MFVRTRRGASAENQGPGKACETVLMDHGGWAGWLETPSTLENRPIFHAGEFPITEALFQFFIISL